MEILGLLGTAVFGISSIWLWVKSNRKQNASDIRLNELNKKQDDLIDLLIKFVDKEDLQLDRVHPKLNSLGAETGDFVVEGKTARLTVNLNQAEIIRGIIKQTLPGIRISASGKVTPSINEGEA